MRILLLAGAVASLFASACTMRSGPPFAMTRTSLRTSFGQRMPAAAAVEFAANDDEVAACVAGNVGCAAHAHAAAK